MKKVNKDLRYLDFAFNLVGRFANSLLNVTIKVHDLMNDETTGETMSNEDLGRLLSGLAKECVKLIDEKISPDTVAKLVKMKIDPIEAILLHMKRVDRSDCVNINQEF